MKLRKRFVFKFYGHHEIFWLVRLNALCIPSLRCLEFTCGALGYGVLTQFYYGEPRV